MIPHRALLFLGVMVVGCASSQMTSMSEPAGKGKQYQRFIVWARVEDPYLRRQMERRVVQRLEEAGAEAFVSIDLLPPTRGYSESDINTVLWAKGIEGFLILSVNESAPSRVPGASGSVAGGGNHPKASLQSELFDVLYQRRAWVSMARTKESEDATFERVAPFCDEVVERMLADKLLSRKGRQSPFLTNGGSAEQ